MTDLQLFIMQLFTNPVLLCAVFSWLTAQFIKLFTTPNYRHDRSILQVFFGSGGMPSSHSAAVCSAAIAAGLHNGFDSPLFAIAGVLAVVVIRDATGIRREAGKHAVLLNQITEELNKNMTNGKSEEDNAFETTLRVLLGHTPLQVFFGSILGVAMAFICHYWAFPNLFVDHVVI